MGTEIAMRDDWPTAQKVAFDTTEPLAALVRAVLGVGEPDDPAVLRTGVEVAEKFDFPSLKLVLTRKADARDITAAILTMLAAYPSSKPKDVSGFSRLLGESIFETKPTAYAVQSGLTVAYRTITFCPSIAEALRCIADAESRLQTRLSLLSNLPEILTEAKARLAHAATATPVTGR